MSENGQKKQLSKHPYLNGNFAPVTRTSPLRPATFSGRIPVELNGGMYVRNGGNPISNSDLGREAHWFDGDGMLTGVWFDRTKNHNLASPYFVNQFVLTDLCLSSFENENLRTPILPSIATLVSPFARLVVIIWRILRSAILVLLSHLPGSQHAIKRISVANTAIVYHDGRALATCESGPPIRVLLPELETIGWFNGNGVEEEHAPEENWNDGPGFGGTGLNSWMREWTTGHPKVDPFTREIMLFHCNFLPPYVHYSLVPIEKADPELIEAPGQKLMNVPVPGCSGGKMMHDFGVSRRHTVILDLPLSLSPFNLLKNNPIVAYEPEKPARFGVFPRRDPSKVRWFETNGCCIFHTANTWDEIDNDRNVVAVKLLACRLTSASLVFSAGNITPPSHPNHKQTAERRPISFFAKYDDDDGLKDIEKDFDEKTPLLKGPATAQESMHQPAGPSTPPVSLDDEEQCRLYYYRFDMSSLDGNRITDQYALSSIPFEFPTVSPAHDMTFARYIYGCSTSNASFGAALGKATKIDVIVKMDVQELLAQARNRQPQSVTGCVDTRSIQQVLASSNPNDPIQAFKLPPKHYAQEARFVPRDGASSEDDGYLLFYVFDESQLDENGVCREDATSDLWVLDAKDMRTGLCTVHLPTRVPYGLHGNWFSAKQIQQQRGVARLRKMPDENSTSSIWDKTRRGMVGVLG